MNLFLSVVFYFAILFSYCGLYASLSQDEPVDKHTSSSSLNFTITVSKEDKDIFTKYSPAELSTMPFEKFKKVINDEIKTTQLGKDFFMNTLRPSTTNQLKYKRLLESLHRAATNIEVKQFAEKLGEEKEDSDPKGEMAKAFILKTIRSFQEGNTGPIKLGEIRLDK